MSKYIGITGFADTSDHNTARACAAMMPAGWRFMAGVLVSAKTLCGAASERRRYPRIEEVPPIVKALRANGAWPVAHFNTRAETGTKLLSQLAELMSFAPGIAGIQLNIVRPSLEALRVFKSCYPHVELIVQANRSAFGEAPSAAGAIAYAREYADVASHVLLDLSGGVGAPLDVELAKATAREWRLRASLGVAGGLDASTVSELRGLRVSCDAETRVRTADDRLDDTLARAYTRAAVTALCVDTRSEAQRELDGDSERFHSAHFGD